MQLFRTILWVVILAALLAFSFFNWREVEVTIWENLVLETKVPALVIVSFLLGLIPMWMIHRGAKWRLNRRISSLEAAAESQRRLATPSATAPAPTPGTSSIATDPAPQIEVKDKDAGPLTSDPI